MNQNRVISTAVLFLLLGTTIPALAQKGQEEKGGGGGKAQPAQHQAQPQRAQQAKPQRAQRAQQQPQHTQQAQRSQRTQQVQRSQRTQQAQRQQQPQRAQRAQQSVANNRGGNHYGRIPDNNYRAHFGRDHRFRMGRPRFINGYNRFQYGGYWFGFNQGWPVGWDYNDDVYVVYEGGAYYMYNHRHPGIHITLNLF